jgi:hypothetical protein
MAAMNQAIERKLDEIEENLSSEAQTPFEATSPVLEATLHRQTSGSTSRLEAPARRMDSSSNG